MLSLCKSDVASVMNHHQKGPEFVFEAEFENDDSEENDVTRWETKNVRNFDAEKRS